MGNWRRVYWKVNEGGGFIGCHEKPEAATRIDVEVGGGPYIGSYTWEFHDVRREDGTQNLYHIEKLERMLRKAFEFGREDAKSEIRRALGVQK